MASRCVAGRAQEALVVTLLVASNVCLFGISLSISLSQTHPRARALSLM